MRNRIRWRAAILPVLLCATAAGGCWIEVEEEEGDLRTSIENMLYESAEAWNRGDLSGFMDDYLQSETTTYIGSAGMLTGYDAVRARYAPLFQPGAARDSLRFEDIRARRLGAVDGVVTARRVLYRGSEVTGSGPLTLVVRRTSSGWKIIHDHSSSDPRQRAAE